MENAKLNRWMRSLEHNYGLHTRKISSRSSIYKKVAAYRVATNKGPFLFKAFQGDKVRRMRMSSLIAKLERLDFSPMPQWIKTRRGRRWMEHNGRFYYVWEWIEGTELGGSVSDYERLGEVLAQLHRISRRRSSASFTAKQIERFKLQHQSFAGQLKRLSRKLNGYREMGKECLLLAEEAWNIFKQPGVQRILRREKSALIHGDVTRPNVIVGANGIYLVDWDLVRRGSVYYEVAKTLNNTTLYSVNNMKAFLTGYEKHQPLVPEERLLISSLFRLPREVWNAARSIRVGKPTALLAILEKTWSERMEAVRWMDNWAKELRDLQEPQELQDVNLPVISNDVEGGNECADQDGDREGLSNYDQEKDESPGRVPSADG
jgi:Ser/Thr protein kinase RdoA (MazF antagonist)